MAFDPGKLGKRLTRRSSVPLGSEINPIGGERLINEPVRLVENRPGQAGGMLFGPGDMSGEGCGFHAAACTNQIKVTFKMPRTDPEIVLLERIFGPLGKKRLAAVNVRFADWLRHARRGSQLDLAKKLDVPRSWVSRLESGRVSPTLETIERLAVACGQTLTDVARWIDAK